MPGPLPHLPHNGTLLVLRGNSGSGKSTIAHAVHRHFDHGRSTLIAQDNIRRTILREPDTPGAFTIELIELIAPPPAYPAANWSSSKASSTPTATGPCSKHSPPEHDAPSSTPGP
jgi:ABC-type cobalamin/Fe3+-siderophores transport system ATPase subunit